MVNFVIILERNKEWELRANKITENSEIPYFIKTPECITVEISPDFLGNMSKRDSLLLLGTWWQCSKIIRMLGSWEL